MHSTLFIVFIKKTFATSIFSFGAIFFSFSPLMICFNDFLQYDINRSSITLININLVGKSIESMET